MALRVDVYRKEQYYCLGCGDALADVSGDRILIRCVNRQCQRNNILIRRPDVIDCDGRMVFDKDAK